MTSDEHQTQVELLWTLAALRARLAEHQLRDQAQAVALVELGIHKLELEMQNRELREAHAGVEAARVKFEELYDYAPVAYFTFDVAGTVLEANLTAATLVGRDRAAVLGAPLVALVALADPGAFWAHLRQCRDTRRPAVCELEVAARGGGEPRQVQLVSSPVLDAAGQATAFRTLFFDVTERRRAELEREEARRRERALRERADVLDRFGTRLAEALASQAAVSEAELLALIATEVGAALGADVVAVRVCREVGASLVAWRGPGATAAAVREVPRMAPHPDALEALSCAEGSLRRGAAAVAAVLPAEALAPGLAWACTAPMPVTGRAQRDPGGHLFVAGAAEAALDAEARHTLRLLAVRAGLALGAVRLRDEARAAVGARDSLLAIVSHDLRSPLTTIQLNAMVLDRDAPGHPRVQVVLRAVERMRQLVEDLLEAAAIEAGALRIDAVPQDLAPVLEEAVRALEPIAHARQMALVAEVPPGLPRVRCDRRRIIQVLSNLVGNAVKFGRPGGRVEVRARALGAGVEVAVVDDGPGIAAAQLPHLFDRYWQATARPGGVGLGLHITHGIVAAHGGEIEVESAPGAGATFRFTLRAG